MDHVSIFYLAGTQAFHIICDHNWYCVWTHRFQDYSGSSFESQIPNVHRHAPPSHWRSFDFQHPSSV